MGKIRIIAKYILFLVPGVLGVVGFAVLGQTTVLDALFNVLQMYVLNYGDSPSNIWIELARWTAPLATATGVFLAASRLRNHIRSCFVYIKGGSVAVYGAQDEKQEMLKQLGSCGIEGGNSLVKAERYILLDEEERNMDFYHRYASELAGHQVYLRANFHSTFASGNIKTFCTEETVARLFWKQPHIFEQISKPKAVKQIVLIGFGELGEQLLYWGLLNLIFSPEETIEYHIFGDGSTFRAIRHGMEQITDPVRFYDQPWYTERSLIEQADLVIVIEQERQSELLSDLLLATTAACVDVFAANANAVELLDGNERLRIFRWKEEAQKLSYILDDVLLRRAKRINLRYSHLYQSVEETDENMEREWLNLNTFTRYSNISAADYHEIHLMMLEKMGIEPAAEKIDEDILDQLAHLEHIRWCRYHYLNNWHYGKCAGGARKDSIRRIHTDLVPYEALTEAEKEKNRENIRILLSVEG
jgi:hypothetical protein